MRDRWSNFVQVRVVEFGTTMFRRGTMHTHSSQPYSPSQIGKIFRGENINKINSSLFDIIYSYLLFLLTTNQSWFPCASTKHLINYKVVKLSKFIVSFFLATSSKFVMRSYAS